MRTAEDWLRELPQQFQDKEKIAVLIRAFARQIEEIEQVFSDIVNQTDLETAVGRNLDMVGDIVNLSRKDAMDMDVISSGKQEMTDERYRRFLRYKILKNTSECTYWDLMDGISMMWNMERLTYMETLEYPATILFRGEFDMDESDVVEFYPELCIRSSGVGVLLEKAYVSKVQIPIKAEAAIRLFMEFYPRMNLAPLLLDGLWKLDGSMRLAGVKSEIPVDMYPAEVHFELCADGHTDYEERLAVQYESKAAVKSETALKLFGTADAGTGMKVGISFCTECEVRAEHTAEAVNQRYLDGGWKLDGARPLNGGPEKL